MNIWFFIWLLLSGSLLFFAGWTVYILYMQKKAWRDFATRNKLRYNGGRFFASPEISGTYEGHTISIFTSEHLSEDVRGSRKMTAIEISLHSRMPFNGALASGGMVSIVQQATAYNEEVRPEHKDWQTSYIARANSANALEAYLTPSRLDTLTGLMKMKNAWFIIVYEKKDTLMRIDTTDPLDEPGKIDRILKKLTEAAKALEIGEAEHKALEKLAAEKRRKPKTKAIDVKEDDLAVSLELEDDDETAELPKPEEKQQDL